MKTRIYYIVLIFAFSTLLNSCTTDDNGPNDTGTVAIKWDNIVGKKDMNLVNKQVLDFPYRTTDGQDFNITSFGYYITKIVLEGPQGNRYEDEVAISAAASKGVYHIKESDAASTRTVLQDVPAGTYNKIAFTVGIPEEGVQEGAAGGVLDPAAGAWFWNWNVGYIGFRVEGHASTSSQSLSESNSGRIVPEKYFAFHIGGWRDIVPKEDEPQRFVNNVRRIELELDSPITIAANQQPSVHLLVNAKALFDESKTDFSTRYSVHAPMLGKAFADVFDKVFSFSHSHQ